MEPSTGMSMGNLHVMRSTQGRHPGPWRKIQGAPEGTFTHPCAQHPDRTQHTPENFNIIGREDHSLARTIKESIYIRVKNPTLNRNVGKYDLHHIWDRVLFNTPDLKINNDNGNVHRTSLSWHVQSIPPNRHSHSTIGHTEHALNSEYEHRTSWNQRIVQ